MTHWMKPFSKRLSESADRILAEVADLQCVNKATNLLQVSKPVVDGPVKMGMDIHLDSPVIYVPCSSGSMDGLIVYMGTELMAYLSFFGKFTGSLKMTNVISEDNGAVKDVITAVLSDIRADVYVEESDFIVK